MTNFLSRRPFLVLVAALAVATLAVLILAGSRTHAAEDSVVLEGYLVDSDGKGVPDVRVGAFPEGKAEKWAPKPTVEDGYFKFDLPRSSRVSLVFRYRIYTPSLDNLSGLDSQKIRINFRKMIDDQPYLTEAYRLKKIETVIKVVNKMPQDDPITVDLSKGLSTDEFKDHVKKLTTPDLKWSNEDMLKKQQSDILKEINKLPKNP